MIKFYTISLFFFVLTPVLKAQVYVQPELLEQEINSTDQNFYPLISGDGQTLFFSRILESDAIGEDPGYEDLYVSSRLGTNRWSEPANLGSTVNYQELNSLAGSNANGTELYLINYDKHINAPISVTRKNGRLWSKAQAVQITDYYNDNAYADFHWIPAKNIMLLAVERNDGRGGQDLYVSLRQADGNWATPLNLGPTINTNENDFAPFLSSDGRTLFFASDGHAGYGGSDIFYTTRLDDSWVNWSLPINLGPFINTANEEVYISMPDDMTELFYSSFSNETGDTQLFRCEMPEGFMNPVIDPQTLIVSRHYNTEQFLKSSENQLLAFPSEFEKKSYAGLLAKDIAESAKVEVAGLAEVSRNQGIAFNSVLDLSVVEQNRPNSVQLYEEFNAGEIADAAGMPGPRYFTAEMSMGHGGGSTSHYSSYGALENYVQLSQEVGLVKVDVLKRIYFNFKEAELLPEYEGLLAEINSWIHDRPDIKILLTGHADEIGTADKNYTLGIQRAQAVAEYLRSVGISADRMLLHSEGERMPLASNDDDREGRALNRRVDIQLIPAQQSIAQISN